MINSMDSEELSLEKIVKDRWAFLDEIEAPTWVDLVLEAKPNHQDYDDGWFHSSHMFHQCSSLKLKAAFAHSGEGSPSSDVTDMKEPSSPKLPSSVSRSRGKPCASKKKGGEDHVFLLNKKHPVKASSGKPVREKSGIYKEIKPKLSFINSKGTSSLKSSVAIDRDLTKNANSENNLISKEDKASDSNTSTITCEDVQLQQGNQEVLSRPFGNTSALVSAMRVGLRKSFATRPASRVDASSNSGNRRQSRDSNCVSRKSSVGSNPGYDVKRHVVTLMQHKERTTNNRNEARIKATKIKVKRDSYASECYDVQIRGRATNSRREGTRNTTKPRDSANSKLQSKSIHAKALLVHGVNEQQPSIGDAKVKDKARVNRPNRIVSAGSENSTGGVPVNQECSGGHIVTGKARGLLATKQNVRQKDRRARLPKGKISSSPGNKKPSTNATQRVYLR